jgi:phosphoserine phosphatase RsbU/P
MSPRRMPLIMVVDDDVVTSYALKRVLSRAGFQVAQANNATEGLDGIRERKPDLVLLDINLPDGSGWEVCRKLQAEPMTMRTPVLFISANGGLDSKIKGFEAGGVDYISKPFAGEEIVARVSTHLRLKEAYETLAELQTDRVKHLAAAQKTLMPSPAEFPDARFQVSLNQVLKAGGDFYDVIPVGDQVVDYIVADASGHDLAASFWTATLKTLLGEYATAANLPLSVLQCINSALCRILPEGVFFTLVYARLNRQAGKLVLVNAGHPPAAVLHKEAAIARVLIQEGDVLGAFPDADFGMTEISVGAGDRFFLFSDGLVELGGAREHGIFRFGAACATYRERPLDQMVRNVVTDVTRGFKLQDDILLIGVEV